ncbi:HAD family hydrolase [Wukongibacter baidiensis]|uniref:HAD family hydrolase n=1 Tax=Wukongibacter baidiensis TaxID=1723361 RepID=UPI003D7F4582
MIKGVIFDLDDTLIHEKEYIFSGFKVVSKKIEKDYKIDLHSQGVLSDMIRLFNLNKRNVFNRLLDSYGLGYSSKYIEDLIKLYRNHSPEIKLCDDARYIINYLYNKKVKLGIITDGYEVTQKNKLRVLDIDKYFDCIVITDEIGREYWKPSEVPYQIVQRQLGLEYEEMIYVGDNIEKDFITANRLGMGTVSITRKDGVYSELNMSEKYNAKYKVTSLNELITLNYVQY